MGIQVFRDGESGAQNAPPLCDQPLDCSSIDGPLPTGALAEALGGVRAPGEALQRIIDFVMDATGAHVGAIVLNEETHGYTIACARDASGVALADAAGLLSDAVVADVLDGHGTVCVPDVRREPRYASAPSLVAMRLSAVACVPMTVGRRVLGAIYLGKRAGAAFSSRHVGDLTVLASMAVPFVAQLRRADAAPSQVGDELLGESTAMIDVRRLIERIAPTDLSVLISGETGTGKELTAKALHRASRRAGRPLVATNCSAVAEGLLEAELFGCKKGAFTGAIADREGRIEAANHSTLFLDEVGDMPLAMQAALLRVLQEREVVRLGENKPRPVDFRLVTASNKDLDAEVAAGRFREDLLFRIREVVVPVPPLRARGEDVLLLARLFLRQCETEFGIRVHTLSKGAERSLVAHAWPGNVRELRSTIRRAAVLADSIEITRRDFALPSTDGEPDGTSVRPPAGDTGDLDRTLAEARDAFVSQFVRAVLARHGGHREAAAATLGISLRSLYRYTRPDRARRGHA